jgi:hypothetical protein
MSYGSLVANQKEGLPGYVLAVRSGQADGAVSLPKTGCTTSYETGDDGGLEMGIAWPSPRFIVGTGAESGCITDNLTGLMWDLSGNISGGGVNWTQALSDCDNHNLGGYTDWRLPNIHELESLINAEETDPALWLNGQGFSSVIGDSYWSSTTYAPNTDNAWTCYMRTGYPLYGDKIANCYVLVVRAGQ